jgi:hypothetical protein
MNFSAETTNLDCQATVASVSSRSQVGLRGIAAVLPPRTRKLEDLQRGGLLVSDLSALNQLGFEIVHTATLDTMLDGWRWNPRGSRCLVPKLSPRRSMCSLGLVRSQKRTC